jgi:hypothetical protein
MRQVQLRPDARFANIPRDLLPCSILPSLPSRHHPEASLDKLPPFIIRVGEWFGWVSS